MSLSEFDLIARFCADCGTPRPDVLLGVGDDAALLRVPPDRALAVTQDTLVAGVHFFPEVDPEALGHKALAVNLSDLAAMGAEPAWVTLSLTLPSGEADWLDRFSQGFCGLARAHGVRLVGGDTTGGPVLMISVTAHGWVPVDQALRRRGARPGDQVWVTGTLGDAGLALEALRAGEAPPAGPRERLERPQPRVAEGLALRGLASAAIDVSDGLAADLSHILVASGVGATLEVARLPCSPSVAAQARQTGDWSVPLSAGDDYELCFTLPPDREEALERALAGLAPVTRVGIIDPRPGLRLLGPGGALLGLARAGYEHFPPTGRGARGG